LVTTVSDPLEMLLHAQSRGAMLAVSVKGRELVNAAPAIGARWAQVASALMEIGDDVGARAAAELLTEAEPRRLESWLWLAAAEGALGRDEEALKVIERLRMGSPDDASLCRRAGRHLIDLGREDDAEAMFRMAIALDPNDPTAWEGFVESAPLRRGDEELAQLEQLRLNLGETAAPLDRGVIAYALARAYSKLGDPEISARRVVEGAAFMRSHAAFDTERHERSIDALLQTYDESFFGANDEAGLVDGRPVFLTAPPSHGASWLSHVLSAEPGAAALGRRNALFWLAANPLGDQTREDLHNALARGGEENPLAEVGRAYVSYVHERVGNVRRWIDPSSLTELAGGAIGLALPAARMVIIERDLRDAAWSIYARRFRKARQWTYAPDDIARVLVCHRRLTARWQALFPDRVLRVRYEDLCERTEDEVRRIAFFAGVDAEAAVAEAWTRQQPLQADPPGVRERAGKRFDPLEDALQRAGLV
jgi:Flp pilus assembly protein TadD